MQKTLSYQSMFDVWVKRQQSPPWRPCNYLYTWYYFVSLLLGQILLAFVQTMVFVPSCLFNLSNTVSSISTTMISTMVKNKFPRLLKKLRPNFQLAENLYCFNLNIPFFIKRVGLSSFDPQLIRTCYQILNKIIRGFVLGPDPVFSTGFSRSGNIPLFHA